MACRSPSTSVDEPCAPCTPCHLRCQRRALHIHRVPGSDTASAACGTVEPINALRRPLLRFAAWAVMAAVWIAVAVAVAGLRGDLAEAARVRIRGAGHRAAGRRPGRQRCGLGASVPRRGSRWWTGMLAATLTALIVLAFGAVLSSGGQVGRGVQPSRRARRRRRPGSFRARYALLQWAHDGVVAARRD